MAGTLASLVHNFYRCCPGNTPRMEAKPTNSCRILSLSVYRSAPAACLAYATTLTRSLIHAADFTHAPRFVALNFKKTGMRSPLTGCLSTTLFFLLPKLMCRVRLMYDVRITEKEFT